MHPTLIITQKQDYPAPANKSIITMDFSADNFLDQLCNKLLNLNIFHLMVEGGAALIKSFIKKDLWDEAIIIDTENVLTSGTKAPNIEGTLEMTLNIDGNQVHIIKNKNVFD